jgi:hypothetical protein
MPIIRFVDEERKTFTGFFGTIEFRDGVSVNDVSGRELAMIGCLVRIAPIDSDELCGASEDLVRAYAAKPIAAVETPLELASASCAMPAPRRDFPPDVVRYNDPAAAKALLDAQALSDTLGTLEGDLDKAFEKEVVTPTSQELAEASQKIWTVEELHGVADVSGIKGLREIGDPMNVRNTSIHGLIEEIVHRQANPKVVH